MTYDAAMRHLRASKLGRKAIRITKTFRSIRRIPKIIMGSIPGIPKGYPLAGLGKATRLDIANGPDERSATRIQTVRFRNAHLLGDPRNGRMIVWAGKSVSARKSKPTFKGWVKTTFYRGDSTSEEKNGNFYHNHSESGGTWPAVYMDKAGNYVFGKSSYTFGGRWLRR